MFAPFKRIHYIFAGTAFLTAFLTYVLTMQPTIPFWDCGEFAAAASALQVPHPPGAPLWTLVGRIAMLLPTFTDPAARYNLFSVLASAGSVLLLYLTLARLITLWRGAPRSMPDALVLFGGAFIGALSYCWTDSFWFNALECEVYAFGSLFISLVPWLLLLWHEHAEEEHHEKYLLLIAYVIGLSLGVHQLALLTMFPAFMIVYYRRREQVTVASWLKMVGLSVVTFVVVFYVILSNLVAWAGNGKGYLAVFVLAAIVGSIAYGEIRRRPTVALSGWALMMVFLGYTTYMFVMVRGSQDPPMNENAPSTFSKLAGYINRDQYGSMSLSDEIVHRRQPEGSAGYKSETWNNYSSNAEFFWKYQTNFMFHRYLGWNFVGRDGDFQGAGVAFWKTLALPFLLGLFGIVWHYYRDPKRWLTLLGAFIIMGYLVCWYQNQQDPQPRERDYFYVGAFYIFAMWVGIGAVGIFEFIQEKCAAWNERRLTRTLIGAFALVLLLGPINQCVGLAGMLTGKSFAESSKWAEYSRKDNWVPWEYAYNILQSCDKDAILFTYGDNDTFPLWCIQDAFGIRRDVRIVQLQLATMMWNVKQLRTANDWGGKAVRFSTFTDEVVNMSDNDAYSRLDWQPKPLNMPISAATAQWITGDTASPATTFGWTPKFIIPSDQVVFDIIRNNITDRPIYYAVTVPENSRAGLNNYLMYEGLTARVTPFPQPPDNTGIGGSIQPTRFAEAVFHYPQTVHADPDRGMVLHSYSDPDAHRSYMDDEYSMTYRFEFIRLANWYVNHQDLPNARRTLDTLEARIPIARVDMDFSFASFVADLADKAGNWPIEQKYAAFGAKKLSEQMQNSGFREQASNIDPDYQLANLQMRAGEFGNARKGFTQLRSSSKPEQQPLFQLKLDEVDARELESRRQFAAAYQKFTQILNAYAPDRTFGADLQDLRNHQLYDSLHQ